MVTKKPREKRKSYEGVYISYPPDPSIGVIAAATARAEKLAQNSDDADLILMMLGLRESPPTKPQAPRRRRSKVSPEDEELAALEFEM